MAIFTKLIARIKGNKDSFSSDWSELESELLQADLGPSLAAECIEQAKKIKYRLTTRFSASFFGQQAFEKIARNELI